MNETYTEKDYSNRELDRMFKEIMDTLARVETQTTKTNGRVTKQERIILVIATILIVLLVTSNPSFAHLLSFIPGL